MKILEIEPTNTCNLRYIMCHMSFTEPKTTFFDVNLLEKINIKDSIVKIASVYELFIHPDIDKIIEYFAKNNNQIFITTNLTNFSDKTLQVLEKYKKNIYNISISIDSTNREIYESIRRGAKFEKVIENIKKLSEIRDMYIRINTVIIKKNYKHLIKDIDFFNSIGIKQIGLIFMTVRDYMVYEESLYPIKEEVFKELDKIAEYVIKNNLDIVVSSPYYNISPLREKYENHFKYNMVGNNFSQIKENKYTQELSKNVPDYMNGINCSALEKLIKIFPSGNVQLCYQFIIGNLKDYNSLDKLLGKGKKWVLDKILNEKVCEKCDFYRFCIKGSSLDINKKENYFSQNILNKKKYIALSKDTKIEGHDYLKDYDFIFGDEGALHRFKEINKVDNVYLLDEIDDVKNAVFLINDRFHFQVHITYKLIKKGAKDIHIYSSKHFPKELKITHSFTDVKSKKYLMGKKLNKDVYKFEKISIMKDLTLEIIKIIYYDPNIKLIAIPYDKELYTHKKIYDSVIYQMAYTLKETLNNPKIVIYNVKEKPIRTLMSTASDYVLTDDNILELYENMDNLGKVKGLYYYDKYLDVVHT